MSCIIEYMDEYFKEIHPSLIDFLSENDSYGMKFKLNDYMK